MTFSQIAFIAFILLAIFAIPPFVLFLLGRLDDDDDDPPAAAGGVSVPV